MTQVNLKQAREINEALRHHGIRYLFIGKLGAILLGFRDTTRDADLFIHRKPSNSPALVAAVSELGFVITSEEFGEIEHGKEIVELSNGPFGLDLVFKPRGLKDFESSWKRHIEVDGIPVCHPDELIRIKEALNRVKDTESLPRLRDFRDRWIASQ